MNDDDKLFPLPAGATSREQAVAMARAAWLMGSPVSSRTATPETPDNTGKTPPENTSKAPIPKSATDGPVSLSHLPPAVPQPVGPLAPAPKFAHFDFPLPVMLLILQIGLFACFCVTLVQVLYDLVEGTCLILSGLMLLAVGYSLKLVAILLLHCRGRHLRRLRPAPAPRWKVIAP